MHSELYPECGSQKAAPSHSIIRWRTLQLATARGSALEGTPKLRAYFQSAAGCHLARQNADRSLRSRISNEIRFRAVTKGSGSNSERLIFRRFDPHAVETAVHKNQRN